MLIADQIEDFFDMMHKIRQPAEPRACARAFQRVHGTENSVDHVRIAGVEFQQQQRAAKVGKQVVRFVTERSLQFL